MHTMPLHELHFVLLSKSKLMKSESTNLAANEMFRVSHLKQQKPSGCFQGISKKTSDISWVNAFTEKIKDQSDAMKQEPSG